MLFEVRLLVAGTLVLETARSGAREHRSGVPDSEEKIGDQCVFR